MWIISERFNYPSGKTLAISGSVLILILLGVCLLLPISSSAQTPVSPLPDEPDKTVPGCWTTYLSPVIGAKFDSVAGLAAISPTDVWAGGTSYIADGTSKALFMHWDDTEWRIIPGPDMGNATPNITKLTAVSSNDVWAVGFYRADTELRTRQETLAMHWDGTKWSVVPSPNPGQFNSVLSGVAAVSANDVWAVGWYDVDRQDGPRKGLITHWNGAQWNIDSGPDITQFGEGEDISAVSSTDIWGIAGARIIHWDGSKWSLAATPDTQKEDQYLGITTLGPNNVWAVGTRVTRIEGSPGSTTSQTLTLHWDGQAWNEIPSPNTGDFNVLHAVGAASPDDMWAVGEPFTQQSLFLHWNGQSWVVDDGPWNVWVLRLSSVAATPGGDTWIAGIAYGGPSGAGSRGVILRHTNGQCAKSASKTPTVTTLPTSTTVATQPPTPVEIPGTGSYYFPETGKEVRGIFLDYWAKNGGVMQQGLPISEPLCEASSLNGKTYTVQYFERATFEYHPENQPPYDVLLSQLGRFQYDKKYPTGAANQKANDTPGSIYFSETKHRLGGEFLRYWETHGGVIGQGYPISDEFSEISEIDGKPYTVQYFERAVFEKHPENNPPYNVLLSQVGKLQYDRKFGGK